MAHSRTARKNIRKSARRRAANRSTNAAMRTQLKKVHRAVAAKDAKAAAAELNRAQKLLDKAAKTHRIHPNKAARLKSKLTRATNAGRQLT